MCIVSFGVKSLVLPCFSLSSPSAAESRCRGQPLAAGAVCPILLNSGSAEAKTSPSLEEGTRHRTGTSDTPAESAAASAQEAGPETWPGVTRQIPRCCLFRTDNYGFSAAGRVPHALRYSWLDAALDMVCSLPSRTSNDPEPSAS